MDTPELRPLGAGEMLDRAITLYVRRFASIVAVLAVVNIPIVLAQAFAVPDAAHPFDDLARVLSTSGQAGRHSEPDPFAMYARIFTPFAIVITLAALLLRVLVWGAVVAVVAAAYSGTRVTLGDAYRIALRRWVPQLIVGFAFMIIGSLAMIPAFIGYIVLILVVVAAAALKMVVVSVTIGIVGGLIVIALFIAIAALIFMTYELASVAVMTESANPVDAIGIAMRRAFAAGMKRRTLVGGIVLGLVSQVGTLPLVAVGAVATAFTHWNILYFAIIGAGTVLIEGILAAFAVVYAVDARIRREGFDLVVPEPPLTAA